MENMETHTCGEEKNTAQTRFHRTVTLVRRFMEIQHRKLISSAPSAVNKRTKHNKEGCSSGHVHGEGEEIQRQEVQSTIAKEMGPRYSSGLDALLVGSEQAVDLLTPWVYASENRDKEGDQGCPPWGALCICGRKPQTEDALTIVPNFQTCQDEVFHFFAVYDGHGGQKASLYCKERLHEVLAEEIAPIDPKMEDQWKAAVKACFIKMDAEVPGMTITRMKSIVNASGNQDVESHEEGENNCDPVKLMEMGGTTAVVALVSSRQIVVANCGDSRAVLSRNGKAIPLSTDHKPDLPEEKARIEAAGGSVMFRSGTNRVFGILAMSRSIGDRYLEPFVTAEPELSFTERIAEDECLVLASDGLWDMLSNDQVCGICRHFLQSNFKDEGRPREAMAATYLTKFAIAQGSSDDISVVVVNLSHR